MIANHLVQFFNALDQHQPSHNHAITYCDGVIHILVGMGDVRVRVAVASLDSDPTKAAERVIQLWRSMSAEERDAGIEEVR